MNFALFLLLNAVLLIRPEELFPDIAGLRLYLIVIVLCTVTSLPRLIELLSPASLRTRPVAVCVLLFFASTIISLCASGAYRGRRSSTSGPSSPKSSCTTSSSSRSSIPPGDSGFLATLVVLVVVLTAIALANHNGMAHFENIKPRRTARDRPRNGRGVLCSSDW